MTREEFLKRRAVAHHVKTIGVTQCPPAAAEGQDARPLTVRQRKAAGGFHGGPWNDPAYSGVKRPATRRRRPGGK